MLIGTLQDLYINGHIKWSNHGLERMQERI